MGIVNITWLCLLSIVIKTNSISRGICMRKLNDSTTEAYCCQHYFNASRGCQECASGLTSINGVPCFPCSNGTYGRRCRNTCSCNNNKRCHHMNGCMQNNETLSDLFNGNSTFQLHTIPSTTTYDLQTSSSENVNNGDTKDIHTSSLENVNHEDTKDHTLLIYIMSSGGLLLCIGLLAFIHRYKHNIPCAGKELATERVTVEFEETGNIPDIILERNESVYDIINEEDIIQNLNAQDFNQK